MMLDKQKSYSVPNKIQYVNAARGIDTGADTPTAAGGGMITSLKQELLNIQQKYSKRKSNRANGLSCLSSSQTNDQTQVPQQFISFSSNEPNQKKTPRLMQTQRFNQDLIDAVSDDDHFSSPPQPRNILPPPMPQNATDNPRESLKIDQLSRNNYNSQTTSGLKKQSTANSSIINPLTNISSHTTQQPQWQQHKNSLLTLTQPGSRIALQEQNQNLTSTQISSPNLLCPASSHALINDNNNQSSDFNSPTATLGPASPTSSNAMLFQRPSSATQQLESLDQKLTSFMPLDERVMSSGGFFNQNNSSRAAGAVGRSRLSNTSVCFSGHNNQLLNRSQKISIDFHNNKLISCPQTPNQEINHRLHSQVQKLREQNMKMRASQSTLINPSTLGLAPNYGNGNSLYEFQIQQLKNQQSQNYCRQQYEKMKKVLKRLEQDNSTLDLRVKQLLTFQQDLESQLQNYEVKNRKQNDELKLINRKLGDSQRRYSESEKEVQLLEEKNRKLQVDKNKLNQKWVRLSTRMRNDEKNKQKYKEMQEALQKSKRETNRYQQLYDKSHKQVNHLRSANDNNKQTIIKLTEQLKQIKNQRNYQSQEKVVTDKVTCELLTRIKNYEKQLDLLRQQNRQFVKAGNEVKEQQVQIEDLHFDLQKSENKCDELMKLNQELIGKLENYQIDNKRMNELVGSLEAQTNQASANFHQMERYVTSLKKNFQEAFDSIQFSEKSLSVLKFSDRSVTQALKVIVEQLNGGATYDARINQTSLTELTKLKEVQLSKYHPFRQNKVMETFLIRCAEKLNRLSEALRSEEEKSKESYAKFDRMVRKYKALQDQNRASAVIPAFSNLSAPLSNNNNNNNNISYIQNSPQSLLIQSPQLAPSVTSFNQKFVSPQRKQSLGSTVIIQQKGPHAFSSRTSSIAQKNDDSGISNISAVVLNSGRVQQHNSPIRQITTSNKSNQTPPPSLTPRQQTTLTKPTISFLSRVNSVQTLTPNQNKTPGKVGPILSARITRSPPKRTLLLPPQSPSSTSNRKLGMNNRSLTGENVQTTKASANYSVQGVSGPMRGNHLLNSFDTMQTETDVMKRGGNSHYQLPPTSNRSQRLTSGRKSGKTSRAQTPKSSLANNNSYSSQNQHHQQHLSYQSTPKRLLNLELEMGATPPSHRSGSQMSSARCNNRNSQRNLYSNFSPSSGGRGMSQKKKQRGGGGGGLGHYNDLLVNKWRS